MTHLKSSSFQWLFKSGTYVAKGRYFIPKGVAVEQLNNYNGHKQLKDSCPNDVQELLARKGLFDVYDQFVQEIYDTSETRGFLGKWKDAQFIHVLDRFSDAFASKGLRVVLCKRKSANGTYRWLEFIDVEVRDSYVPQFDVSNFSEQIIQTHFTKLQFPNGVAVEELKYLKRRKELEIIPMHVKKMIEKHNLINEYEQMVDHIIEVGVSSNWNNWKLFRDVLEVYKPMFHDKGVDIFVCQKGEYVSHGQYRGHMEYFRWIEFVDRLAQPSYYPQRSVDVKRGCTIM